MTDTLLPADETPVPSQPTRRGPGGRLYHGETAIDFYGHRRIGLYTAAIIALITIVSLFRNSSTSPAARAAPGGRRTAARRRAIRPPRRSIRTSCSASWSASATAPAATRSRAASLPASPGRAAT